MLTLTLLTLGAQPAYAFDCPKACEALAGDVNGDNAIDIADLQALANYFQGEEVCPGADVNGDGNVDIADMVYLLAYLQGGPAPINQWCCSQCEDPPIPGDVNNDGVVDIADTVTLADIVAGNATGDECLAAADINGDGQITEADTKLLLAFLFDGGAAPGRPECID